MPKDSYLEIDSESKSGQPDSGKEAPSQAQDN